MIIKDGLTGNIARVGDSNRLATTAVTVPVVSMMARRSGAWDSYVETTVTNATANALWYLKNTGTADIIFELLVHNAGASTGGSGQGRLRITRNPTAGTLVSAASAGTVNNRDFGSSSPPDATIYQLSALSQTFTDGTVFFDAFFGANGRGAVALDGGIIVPTGASIGFTVTAPAGNTSMVFNLGIVFYNPIENLI